MRAARDAARAQREDHAVTIFFHYYSRVADLSATLRCAIAPILRVYCHIFGHIIFISCRLIADYDAAIVCLIRFITPFDEGDA